VQAGDNVRRPVSVSERGMRCPMPEWNANSRGRMLTSRSGIFALLLAVSALEARGQDGYYTWDGYSLAFHREPPNGRQVWAWEVWLYRRGEARHPEYRWGSITGTTPEQVMAELRKNQELDQRANGLCRCPPSNLTYENFHGPIAVLKRPPRAVERAIAFGMRLKELKEQADKMRDLYRLTTSTYQAIPQEFTPFDNVGEVLREYALTTQRATLNISKARALMDHAETSGSAAISAALGEVERALALNSERDRRVDAAYAAWQRSRNAQIRQGLGRGQSAPRTSTSQPPAGKTQANLGISSPGILGTYRYRDRNGNFLTQNLSVSGDRIVMNETWDTGETARTTVEYGRIGEVSYGPFYDGWFAQVSCPDWREKSGYYRIEGTRSTTECEISFSFPDKAAALVLYRHLLSQKPRG
jgi:hypothetical protein